MVIYENKNINFTEECSVIWFPEASHVALGIDQTFYNLFFKCIEAEHADTTKRPLALEGKSRWYYQFHIGLHPEEKQQLLQNWSSSGIHTCSGNAARVLTKTTNMTFPWFKSWAPANLAQFLYETRDEPNSRVLSIEYVGVKTKQPDLCQMIAKKKWEEWDSFFASVGILLTLAIVYLLGELVKTAFKTLLDKNP